MTGDLLESPKSVAPAMPCGVPRKSSAINGKDITEVSEAHGASVLGGMAKLGGSLVPGGRTGEQVGSLVHDRVGCGKPRGDVHLPPWSGPEGGTSWPWQEGTSGTACGLLLLHGRR